MPYRSLCGPNKVPTLFLVQPEQQFLTFLDHVWLSIRNGYDGVGFRECGWIHHF